MPLLSLAHPRQHRLPDRANPTVRLGLSDSSARTYAKAQNAPGLAKPEDCSLALRVVGEPLPVDDDARLISDDPSIMARCHGGEVTRDVLHFLAIVHHDLHPA
jgi:hypothetical protein